MLTPIAFTAQLDTVKEIALRMRDPESVRARVLGLDAHHPHLQGRNPSWGGVSLEGYAGPLLLFAELDQLFPDEQWHPIVHSYVLKIKSTLETGNIHSMPLSIFGGLAGICFALHQGSRNGSRYRRLLNALNEQLLEKAQIRYFAPLKDLLSRGESPPMYLYDLIEGIVGLGSYSLNCLSDPHLVQFTEQVANILVGLTKDIQSEGKWVPGWLVLSRHQHLEQDRLHYTLGNFNLGLSHGVTGILAFLSVALLRGISVEGQREAIEKIASWLQHHRKEDQGAFFWPSVLSFEEIVATTSARQQSFSGRDAWCYGTPGVARTLFLAAEALKDDSLKTFALDSFRSVFKRSREQWGLPGPTCCHGIAGLMLLTLQMANDTQEKDLKDRVIFLNQLLLRYFRPEHPFGFKEYKPYHEGYLEVDHVGLLEGSTGILLTCLAATNRTSWWHAPFLVGYGK